MERVKKIFGEYKISWKKLILLAVIVAVITAVMLIIPFLENTSFQDIGVYLDWWFVFAVFIIINCDKWYEASLKCFVFFLISQPLIYLLQVPFSHLGIHIFMYYKTWFIFTLLTLPGAAVAFLVKKKNWYSALVLMVPIYYYANMAVSYIAMAIRHFPHHLLSGILAVVFAGIFIFGILEEKKHKQFEVIFFIIVLAACIAVPSLRLA